jgi:hypothetical protein
MGRILLLLLFSLLLLPIDLIGQFYGNTTEKGKTYLFALDDAQLDIGLKTISVFALDDRASLYANPHFKAMWNLIRLGATVEAILNGNNEPLNDIDLGKKYGKNGYNKTVMMLFIRYGFGESSDLKIQQHFFELGISPGYFRQGNRGMNLHLDYRNNIIKTGYGAGGNSISRAFDHEIYVGGRIGFDWSFGRSESEAGFFSHLNDEIKRIARQNDFSVAQLLLLEQMAETSKVLLPEDVGGRAFHIGPVAGARISMQILRSGRFFLEGNGFYDLMDHVGSKGNKENKRSQHHISLGAGLQLTIGGEGRGLVQRGFF